jgi:tetratricopeptide (TPR) repeat protein
MVPPFRRRLAALALVAGALSSTVVPAGSAGSAGPAAPAASAPPDLGAHRRDVGASSAAQAAFDRGLVLAYGFNHAGAERAFRAAARLDPECAACWWGVALVLGPHINAAMDAAAVVPAWEALERARALAPKAKPADRALIQALGRRYAAEPPAERAPLDAAYAEAMRDVAARFPDDADVQTLFVEALMDLHPWDLWERDGRAKPWTDEIVARLEAILARWPGHPAANHYYIHAVEASKRPERAMAAAERLRDLVPDAGHLVHMPAHVFIRTGRYWDAIEANRRAIEADRRTAEAAACHGAGLYELGYVPHNPHFLFAAAAFAGAGELAVRTAAEIAAAVDAKAMREPGYGTLQHYLATPYYGDVRFGRWREILAAPEPDADLVYPRGVWRWARGLAHVRTGAVDAAKADLVALTAHSVDPALEGVTFWDINAARDVLAVAREHLSAEIAFARGERETAWTLFAAAAAAEDSLRYDEPPPWVIPVRQFWGERRLAAGAPAEAEALFRADLEAYPENGWSLGGLTRALEAQGRAAEAAEARARRARAFDRADVKGDSAAL